MPKGYRTLLDPLRAAAVQDVAVAMAEAAGLDLDLDFIGRRRGFGDVGQHQAGAGAVPLVCFHREGD